MIEVRDLAHTYLRGTPLEAVALRGVTLAVGDGEFVGLVGPTGSGKSTLVQHLNALLRPTAGQVLLDGADVNARGVDLRRVRQTVGLVFQYPEHQLFEETVAEDVAFGPRNLGLPADEIAERVRVSLEEAGLDVQRFGARSPFGLSGGEMRRAAIAGVLAMRPRVLVLDEPTAGLDPLGKTEILGLVRRLHERGGLTVILITHNMDEVARAAQRVVVMHEGRVYRDGPVREVFAEAEALRAIGLDVPRPARILEAVRARGVAVRTNVLTIEEARGEILRALAARGTA